ncbi:MAG: universal stress protein [Deltaproteobacteria bacterium]|nr:universal stress protein [Deltaproteobacteria bacterium]
MAIVCATDFSPGAEHGLRTAAAFARACGERLLLVHVTDLGALAWTGRKLQDELSQAATARLAEVAAGLASGGLEVETRALVGRPDERIGELAREVSARLLVMGIVGHRPGPRWRVGSLATRLARAVPAPVLLAADAAPFEACAGGRRALRALVAVDASASGDAAAAALASLRRLGACDALLLHLCEPAGAATARAELEARFGAPAGPGTTEIRIEPAVRWLADQIALVAEQERADVVVVGGRQRSGLERIRQDSVSEALLRLAPASVLRAPAGGA